MKIYSEELSIKTEKKFQIVNITSHVERVVQESRVSEGFCLIFVPHATAALIVNECEPRIMSDYIKWITEVFRPGGGWRHDEIDDNAHAHIASSIIGTSRVLPVRGGALVRGTWQEVMLVELDGPRIRRVIIQVVGE
ncbi:MAG: secondary thiamine-phosphate synthase enzyme YjbQ [Thermoprotei archaeon]